MSFAINPSLTHINIPDANILDIYRSKGQVQLSDTRFRGHPCEAVICVSRVDKTVTACVALLETVMNSIFVYTSDISAEQSADYPKVLAEAQEFTTSFGFTMEKVNLEFSPAMREVIIKGIRVMRPPPKKAKLRTLNTLVHLEQSSPEPMLPTAFSASASSAEKSAESERLSTGQLRKEIEAVKAEKQATTSSDNDQRIHQLESALDIKVSEGKDLQNEVSRLTAQLETIAKAKLHLADELSKEKNSAVAEISKLTAEIDSINSLLTAEKNAAAETMESLTFLENYWKESRHREEDLCRNIDIMKEQIGQLEAELAKLNQQQVKEEALLLKIAALEKEAADAKKTMEKLAGNTPDRNDLTAELKSLSEARNHLEAEYIRMANDAMAKEAEMLETLHNADSEIFRLSRELEQCQQVAEAEKKALRNELTRMTSASTGTITAPGTAKSSESSAAAPSSKPAASSVNIIESAPEEVFAEDDTPDESIIVENEIMAGLLNEFGSFCVFSRQSATEFTLDPDIRSIEYSEPGEVLAILYSSNSVQAVPDNKGVKKCKGYIVALKKSGKYSVYLAWLLTESGKVVICTPEQQPADAVECTQIIQDAVSYFEIVGFMMEVEELGNTVKSYNRAIKRVPALSRK